MLRLATVLATIAVAASALVALSQSDSAEVAVRVVTRQLDDGRVEFALEQNDERIYPRRRMFPADAEHSRWLKSSSVTLQATDAAEVDVRIAARQRDDGRVEFALEHDRELIYPRLRMFPADASHSRWLKSSLVTIETPLAVSVGTDAHASACDMESAKLAVQRSTVKVVTRWGIGSAFYIGGGEFVTAAHVVEDASAIRLTSAQMPATSAVVVGYLPDSDVAILRASSSLPALTWHNDETSVGMAVGIAGYPAGLGDVASISTGVVSRAFTGRGVSYVLTDAATSPGNSGGPLFDACGQVIGIISSKIGGGYYEGMVLAVADPSLSEALVEIRRLEFWIGLWNIASDELRVDIYSFFDIDAYGLDVHVSTYHGHTTDLFNIDTVQNREPAELSRVHGALQAPHASVNYVWASVDSAHTRQRGDSEYRCTRHADSTPSVSYWRCVLG